MAPLAWKLWEITGSGPPVRGNRKWLLTSALTSVEIVRNGFTSLEIVRNRRKWFPWPANRRKLLEVAAWGPGNRVKLLEFAL